MKRKLEVILFAFLILNAGTEFHQLFKLPVLVQHFLHHRKEDPSVSFIHFLKIHYTDKNHPADNDEREDNNLPFKSTGNISHFDTPVMAKKVTIVIGYYLADIKKTFHAEGIPSHRSFPVFHPPRIV
jgi:hypothetical protein